VVFWGRNGNKGSGWVCCDVGEKAFGWLGRDGEVSMEVVALNSVDECSYGRGGMGVGSFARWYMERWEL